MNNTTCPCEECICLVICKHKQFHKLFRECSTLYNYEPQSDLVKLRNKHRLFLVQRILKPTIWEFGYVPNDLNQKHPSLYSRSNPQYLVEEKP